MQSSILVTGGAGYIGSHIVKLLSESGEKVVVFDNLFQGKKSNLLHQENLIIGDIRDRKSLAQLFAHQSIDTVIHLAALVNAAESNTKKDEYLAVNAIGSQNIWEEGMRADVKHFLYASSAAVYGIPLSRSPISETTPLSPSNPYGETKLFGEQTLWDTVTPPANSLSFRFFNVGGAEKEGRLGQSRTSRAIMQRLFGVANGDIPNIEISGHDYSTPDGTVVRDFVHVEDIAQAFVLGLSYLRHGGKSTVLNLGGGEGHTIGEVITAVKALTKNPIKIIYGSRIVGDIDYSLADITQARKILNWQPTHTFAQIVQDGYHAYVHQNS